MQKCDREKKEAFDYSGLDDCFLKLAKPAQRALINNKIFSLADLARYTPDQVMQFHGIGPSALPLLKEALQKPASGFAKFPDDDFSVSSASLTRIRMYHMSPVRNGSRDFLSQRAYVSSQLARRAGTVLRARLFCRLTDGNLRRSWVLLGEKETEIS